MGLQLGEIELVDPIKFIGTNEGVVQVILGISPAYYSVPVGREDFDAIVATLFEAWRSGSPVRAVVRGAELVSVEPA